MPVYEFSCSECGKVFEKNVPFDKSFSNIRCPAGHQKVHRIYSPITVVFKGSGFYSTDHGNTHPSDGGKS